MGQYYRPIILNENKKTVSKWAHSFDYDNGSKLMEHSWFLNSFVGAIENELTRNGSFYKSPIVWAGDYADTEKTHKKNLYMRCTDKTQFKPDGLVVDEKYRYIVNHDKKFYVDKTKVPADNDGWKIHPLPLLTCEGNGRGGGDYYGENSIVGTWARDVISIEDEMPHGYDEILFTCVR